MRTPPPPPHPLPPASPPSPPLPPFSQASSLAAAGDVAARISLYRESRAPLKPPAPLGPSTTTTTSSAAPGEAVPAYRERSNTETTEASAGFTPGTPGEDDDEPPVSGIGAALGVATTSLSRGVSVQEAGQPADMMGSMSSLGQIDTEMELDFANMFANESFIPGEGGGWMPSEKGGAGVGGAGLEGSRSGNNSVAGGSLASEGEGEDEGGGQKIC